MWVTESGDAGGGGDTWASTYLDVFRTLNELAGFAAITDGVIFHNTLASSDYGFLAREVFDPRPNYFAVLLWNRLMGTTVYDTAEPIREGAPCLRTFPQRWKRGRCISCDQQLADRGNHRRASEERRALHTRRRGRQRACRCHDFKWQATCSGCRQFASGTHSGSTGSRNSDSCTGNLYILRTVSSAGKQSAPMSKPYKLASKLHHWLQWGLSKLQRHVR